jgi:hypothetical protein
VRVEASSDASWPHVLSVHQEVDRALEHAKSVGIDNPIDAGIVLPDPEEALVLFALELADLFGVSGLQLSTGAGAIEVIDLRDQPRCERSRRDRAATLGWRFPVGPRRGRGRHPVAGYGQVSNALVSLMVRNAAPNGFS